MYEELQRRNDLFNEQADALKAEYPGHELVVSSGHGFKRAIGIHPVESKTRNQMRQSIPSELWKLGENDWFYTPARKTKEGRKLAERLQAIFLKWPPTPGMPGDIYLRVEGKMARPGFDKIGDTFWVYWSCPHETVEQEKEFDGTIWERARSSDFWLAVEASEGLESPITTLSKLVIDCVADAREVLPWLGTYLRGASLMDERGQEVFTSDNALVNLRRIEENLTKIRNAVPAEHDYVHRQIADFLEKNKQ
jgi:hypothetical protein